MSFTVLSVSTWPSTARIGPVRSLQPAAKASPDFSSSERSAALSGVGSIDT